MFQPDGPLEEIDPEIYGIIKHEKARQVRLRATVTFCLRAARCLCSLLQVAIAFAPHQVTDDCLACPGARPGAHRVGELHLQGGAWLTTCDSG